MQPGDEQVVAERIYQILIQPRNPRPTELRPATVDVSGHWDLTVQYSSSTSMHRLYLQQEGNWIRGMHQSEFSSQEIDGTVEGDRVKMRSQVCRPGDRIPFLFSGRACDGRLSGSIFLGEYLTAQFTARRAAYRELREPFVIPGGPPLAT
jgi:hypothetical protein